MAKKQRYDVDIHFNSNLTSLKEAGQALTKLQQKRAQLESKTNLSGAEKALLDNIKKQESYMSRTISKMREQVSHMIRGSVEYNEIVEKGLKKVNQYTVRAIQHQEDLNRAIKEQFQLEQRIAAQEAKNLRLQDQHSSKGVAARTKRALGQSFLEAPLYSASFAVLAGVGNAFVQAVELDKVLTRIGIVTGRSAESMKQFAEYANDAGKALGVTGKMFADASLTFLQQGGLAADYASSLAESSIKLANITGASASDTSEYITAIANSFNLLQKDGVNAGARIVDMLSALDAASGSSADEIAGAFKRSASSFEAAGFSAEEASAMIATVSETTRQSAEMVGTGFKTMIGNLSEIKAGTKEAETITNQLQKVSQQFGLNFSIIDEATNDMKTVPKILSEVADLYNNATSEAARNALVEAVAGKEQRDRFIALITNQERYNELLNAAKYSAGAADLAQARYMQSSEAKINQIKNEWEELIENVINTDGFKYLLDQTSAILGQFNLMTESGHGFLRMLSQIGVVLAPLLAGRLASSGMLSNLILENSFKSGKVEGPRVSALPENMRTLAHEAFNAKDNETVARYEAINRKLVITQRALTVGTASLAGAMQLLNIATNENLSAEEKRNQVISASLPAIGAAIGAFTPLGPVLGGLIGQVAAMAMGFFTADKNAQKFRDTVSKMKSTAKESISNNRQEIEDLAAVVTGTIDKSSQPYKDAANKLGELLPALKLGTDAYGNAILDSNSAIKAYIELIKEKIKYDKIDQNRDISKTLKAGRNKLEEAAAAERDVRALKKAGASQEEIDARKKVVSSFQDEIAAQEQLTKEWFMNKIVASAPNEEQMTAMFAGFPAFLEKLTEEQRQELKYKTEAERKTFFDLYKKDILADGNRIIAEEKALAEYIQSNVGKRANISISEIMSSIGFTGDQSDFEKTGRLDQWHQGIIESWKTFSNDIKTLRIQDIFSEIGNGVLMGSQDIFTKAILGAKNQAAALSALFKIQSDYAGLSSMFAEFLSDGIISKGEYDKLRAAAQSSTYFKIKGSFGANTTKSGSGFKLKEGSTSAEIIQFQGNNALDYLNKAGATTLPVGEGSDKNKKTASDLINDLMKQYEKSRAIVEGLISDTEELLSTLSMSDPEWEKQQDNLIKYNVGLEKQILAEKNALIALGKKNKMVRESAEYQQELNKKNKEYNDVLQKNFENIKKAAAYDFNKVLYGTGDYDKLKEKYDLRQKVLEDTLDTHEKIVSISELELSIQSEIKNTTDSIYESNLKAIQSRIKAMNVNKTSVAILKSELDLLKKITQQGKSGGMKLTRMSNGEFSYVQEKQSDESKLEALKAAQEFEQDVVKKYQEASSLEASLTNELTAAESEKKKDSEKIANLKRRIAIATESVGDYLEEVERAKTVSTLLARGKSTLAAQVLSKSISREAAAKTLSAKDQQDIIDSSKNALGTGISTEGMKLINSNGDLIKKQEYLAEKTVKLNEAITALDDTMRKEIKVDFTPFKTALDGVASAINNLAAAVLKKDTSNKKPSNTSSVYNKNDGFIEKGKFGYDFYSNKYKQYNSMAIPALLVDPSASGGELNNAFNGIKKEDKNSTGIKSFLKSLAIDKNVKKGYFGVDEKMMLSEAAPGETFSDYFMRLYKKGSDARKKAGEESAYQELKKYFKEKLKDQVDSRVKLKGHFKDAIKQVENSYSDFLNNKSYSKDRKTTVKVLLEQFQKKKQLSESDKKIKKQIEERKSAYNNLLNELKGSLQGLEEMSTLSTDIKDYIGSRVKSYDDKTGAPIFESFLDFNKFDNPAMAFATGGYTGEFNGGKLGVLHEKELVLNKLDTSNLLNAIQIIREMPMFNITSPGSMSSKAISANQNIVINADFPGVSSSDEIKKAFESLSTKALQYTYKTKSY